MEHNDLVVVAPVPAREAPAGQVRPEKRVRLSREARIQHILAVSQRLFSTHAYDEIAIEDIAAAAGMSKGLVYHYFASKRDLYLATLRHVLSQMLQFTALHPDLHAGLAETLSLFERYPGLAKMVLHAGIGVDAEVDALLTEYRQQQLDRVYHGLGFADPHPLLLLGLRGWLSLLEEVCMQWVLQPEVTREQVVLLLEQSLHAILTSTLSAVPPPEGALLGSLLGRDGQATGTQRTQTLLRAADGQEAD
jgi:AcrR family transcriptional regulator